MSTMILLKCWSKERKQRKTTLERKKRNGKILKSQKEIWERELWLVLIFDFDFDKVIFVDPPCS